MVKGPNKNYRTQKKVKKTISYKIQKIQKIEGLAFVAVERSSHFQNKKPQGNVHITLLL